VHQALSRAMEGRLAGAAADGPEAARLTAELGRQLQDPGLEPEAKARFVEGLLEHARTPAVQAAVAEAVGRNLTQLGDPSMALDLALKGGKDSAAAKALVRGMDQAITAHPTLKGGEEAAKRLEEGLTKFLGSERVPEEVKLRLAEAVKTSQNPNVRAATAAAVVQTIQSKKAELADRKRQIADEVYGASFELLSKEKHAARHKLNAEVERRFLAEAREKLGPYQKALGELLAGEHGKGTTRAPNSHLGQLRFYLLNTRGGEAAWLGAAKDVMRALFDPPSEQGFIGFQKIVQSLRETTNKEDAHSMGYFIEAGRQALEVDPKLDAKRQREQIAAWGGGAMHVAVAALTGGTGYLFTKSLEPMVQAALLAAGCKLGEVTLDGALRLDEIDDLLRKMQGKLVSEDFENLRDKVRKHLVDPSAQTDFGYGVTAADGEATRQSHGL
jgi:hypothetical protein